MKNNYVRTIICGNKVIALGQYHGKMYRGVAKCAPNDEFDIAKGEELAETRLAERINRERLKFARNRVADLESKIEAVTELREAMIEALQRADDNLGEIEEMYHITCAELGYLETSL